MAFTGTRAGAGAAAAGGGGGLQQVLLLGQELQKVIGLGFWSSGGREGAMKMRTGIVPSCLRELRVPPLRPENAPSLGAKMVAPLLVLLSSKNNSVSTWVDFNKRTNTVKWLAFQES
ncbi:hypothetical protein GH714_014177 [Hevea brasiliensis]|uniref:Uncharacterized protein n=1 Tax=Hevea brasiliensis TaxID=3981 RepID=A0A6A6LKL5_HEVBR|nr:hypothetical protein GH714_014177 [Hevea brasiliensis]